MSDITSEDTIYSDILYELLSPYSRTPVPKTVPTGSIDITFAHAKIVRLDRVVRNLRLKNKSERAIKIGQLKVSIPEMQKSILEAREEIKIEEQGQEMVISERISYMNTMCQQHGRKSEEYKKAQTSVYHGQKRLEYYVKDLPNKIEEYKAFVSSCDKVLDKWTEIDNMSDIPSVDLSFEALMSDFGPQLEYKKHSKHTGRIMDLLQLVRNLRGVPDSSYRQNRASCQIEAQKLRDEIRSSEISLTSERESLEHEIRLAYKQDLRIKLGQEGGIPLNGRDHQISKNLLEGALQERFEKFGDIGMIRAWSLMTDREYLDRLIKYLEPGHHLCSQISNMFAVSRPIRHPLAKKVDELIRDFELLRPYKRDDSANYRQAKKNLDCMMERLHAQRNKDQKFLDKLELDLSKLARAKVRATANDDQESCHLIDSDHQKFSIWANQAAGRRENMRKDIEKISELVIEQ
ncbi:hypothetical protein BTUL_0013g00770 [Botrytis tulipae]|uniref:Uncharacterized protein n=1 Tax=Botrytis tulipae TaxID=87230 RepID=A0A4Z1F911_9HELO|nr:hypothetical protein BTUL_0013g00770 [Botrytis tulipae]